MTMRAHKNNGAARVAEKVERIGSSKGFTLIETLMSLAILLILTGIVVMGIPVAWRTYTQSVNYSNAQLLLTTVTTELRSDLGLAQDVELDSSSDVKYYLSGDGYWESIKSKEGKIQKTIYWVSEASEIKDGTSESKQDLVSSKAGGNLKITYDGNVTYENGVFTISNLKVYDESEPSKAIVKLDSYKIKAFSLKNNVLTKA